MNRRRAYSGTLDPVKTLRLVLLLLLAVLLPVRGALAVVMACPPTAGGGAGLMAMAVVDQGLAGAPAQMEDCHGEQDDAAADAQSHEGVCHLCAALCALTPMTADMAGMVGSPEAVDAAFPRLSAAAPRFESDRLERPPRSC